MKKLILLLSLSFLGCSNVEYAKFKYDKEFVVPNDFWGDMCCSASNIAVDSNGYVFECTVKSKNRVENITLTIENFLEKEILREECSKKENK